MAVLRLLHAHNGQTMDVSRGDLLVVQLPENPTTGYRWALTYVDTNVLQPSDVGYGASPSDSLGSGGMRTFHFEAMRGGQTFVRLTLRRAWDPVDAARERYGLVVTVRPEKQAGVPERPEAPDSPEVLCG